MATHFLAELDDQSAAFILRQEAEPGSLDRREEKSVAPFSKLVFPISEEREMIVNEPLQQCIGFDPDGRIGAGRSAAIQRVARPASKVSTAPPPARSGGGPSPTLSAET